MKVTSNISETHVPLELDNPVQIRNKLINLKKNEIQFFGEKICSFNKRIDAV